MTKLDVVTYGESMGMFVATQTGPLAQVDEFTKRMAGAETNVAIGLARLGLKVGWVSRLGKDSVATYLTDILAREKVNTEGVIVDPNYLTGFMFKTKAAEGEDPKVEYFRKGSAASHMSPADFDTDYFMGARHLHATGISAALSPSCLEMSKHAMDTMRKAGKSVSFDPNLRPSLWPSQEVMVKTLNELAAKADWVLPGVSEGKILTGFTDPRDIAGFYLDLGVKMVVVKLGAEGAYFRTATEEGTVAGVKVKVVDTVGAGDGFAVGVISGMLEGLSIPDAIRRGNHIGAFAIQVIGDMDGLPTRAELDAAYPPKK